RHTWGGELCPTIRIERVIDGTSEPKLLLIVRHVQLKSAHERVEACRLVPSSATGRDVGVPDDAAELDQRGIRGQAMAIAHHLKGALRPLVGVLTAAHIKSMSVKRGGICLWRDELERCIRIDESPDEPRTSGAIDVQRATGDPLHDTGSG